MKIVFGILGILLVLMGAVWILQGFNILATGFMAGHPMYAVLGAVVALLGVLLLVLPNRRRREEAKIKVTRNNQ
jgi:LPXTG-motif cell wall-anchored protein